MATSFQLKPIELKTSSYAVESSTPLVANGTYTGAWVDTSDTGYGYVVAFAGADVGGTLYVDFSDDTTNVNISVSTATAAPTAPKVAGSYAQEADIKTVLLGRYFRIRYVNGATAQTKFKLSRRLVVA